MSPDKPDTNGWPEHAKYVLAKLDENTDDHRAIQRDIKKIEIAIATLKVKSGVWGLMGAAIPVMFIFIHQWLKI